MKTRLLKAHRPLKRVLSSTPGYLNSARMPYGVVPGKNDRGGDYGGSSGGGGGSVNGLVFYWGEHPTSGGIIQGAPLTKRNEFMARLNNPSVETFEGYAVDANLLGTNIVRNGITMSIPNLEFEPGMPAYGGQYVVKGAPTAGRFNSTSAGSKYLDQCGTYAIDADNVQMRFNFAPGVAAFGSYFMDLGDFDSSTTCRITRADGQTINFTLRALLAPEGLLTFFGFVDNLNLYTKIEFFCTNEGDYWGMDDIVFCGQNLVLP